MSNSRLKLRATREDDKPTNSSRGKGLILETPYRPGFVDDKDLESVKMAVDKEFSEISNAFYQTTERTADTITRIDKLQIEGDDLLAKIEEVDKVSKEGDAALASRITTVEATVGDNTALITSETTARVDADKVLGERIDSISGAFEGDLGQLFAEIDAVRKISIDGDSALATSIDNLEVKMDAGDSKLEASINAESTARVEADIAQTNQLNTATSKLDQDIASVQQYASTEISRVDGKVDANGNAINQINAKWGVDVNVNGKVAGIAITNTGQTSAFSVVADRFTVSDGTNDAIAPFEIIGGHTRIKSAYVNSLQSDNWDGGGTGWAITRDGWARFNNVSVRGSITATDGYFENVTITGSCVYQGQINSNQIQDTAVTAIPRASNAINVSTGVGGTTIHQTLSTCTVTTARNYDRVLQYVYPGAIAIRAIKGGSGSKQLIAKVDMLYNGGLIGEATHFNGNYADLYTTNMSGTVVGNIPANTTGSVTINVYLYYQDTTGMSLVAPSQVSQFSIFKVSGELG